MGKTEENIKAAFAGKSQARNKYTYFAEVARDEGYHYIAKIFEETAENEKQHALDHFKLLDGIGNTIANLNEEEIKKGIERLGVALEDLRNEVVGYDATGVT